MRREYAQTYTYTETSAQRMLRAVYFTVLALLFATQAVCGQQETVQVAGGAELIISARQNSTSQSYSFASYGSRFEPNTIISMSAHTVTRYQHLATVSVVPQSVSISSTSNNFRAMSAKELATLCGPYIAQGFNCEPNARITLADTNPNDPAFTGTAPFADPAVQQWAIKKIQAPAAWDITTGDPQIFIGVIDSGIDYNHPDLAGSLGFNFDEYNGKPNVDDDNNGYVDDILGVDLTRNSIDPADDQGHGTHVSGIIGAKTNNQMGIAGTTWKTGIVPVKVVNSVGEGTLANLIEGIYYAVDRGASVLNISLGTSQQSTALETAVKYAQTRGVILVAAAGNAASNNDQVPVYPASLLLDNVISVAASTRSDALASFSNYGSRTVDLAAPGEGIISTMVWPSENKRGYQTQSGTSMAAPFVTGVVALMLAVNFELTNSEIRSILLSTVDQIPALANRVISGGRLNAFGAIRAAGGDSPLPTNTPTLTPTHTPPNTATNTPVNTPTNSPTHTPSRTPTRTPSVTPSFTPSPLPTHTPTSVPTNTPQNTPTATLTATSTRTPSATPSFTPSPLPTNTPTSTARSTNTPQNTATATVTQTSTSTATSTTTPTASHTPTPGSTPATPSQTPTVTPTETPTHSPSNTPQNSPTNTPTHTSSSTATPSHSPTHSSTPTLSPTTPPPAEPTHTYTITPTVTAIPTDHHTHTPTTTATPSMSATPSASPSSTPLLPRFSDDKELTVFVTRDRFSGAMNGWQGAQEICVRAAQAANLVGLWYPLLADSEHDPVDITGASQTSAPIFNSLDQQIALNRHALWMTDLLHAPQFDEYGAPVTHAALTGIGDRGVKAGSVPSNFCNDWRSNSPLLQTRRGLPQGLSTTWHNDASVACSEQLSLYCIGERGLPLTATPTPSSTATASPSHTATENPSQTATVTSTATATPTLTITPVFSVPAPQPTTSIPTPGPTKATDDPIITIPINPINTPEPKRTEPGSGLAIPSDVVAGDSPSFMNALVYAPERVQITIADKRGFFTFKEPFLSKMPVLLQIRKTGLKGGGVDLIAKPGAYLATTDSSLAVNFNPFLCPERDSFLRLFRGAQGISKLYKSLQRDILAMDKVPATIKAPRIAKGSSTRVQIHAEQFYRSSANVPDIQVVCGTKNSACARRSLAVHRRKMLHAIRQLRLESLLVNRVLRTHNIRPEKEAAARVKKVRSTSKRLQTIVRSLPRFTSVCSSS